MSEKSVMRSVSGIGMEPINAYIHDFTEKVSMEIQGSLIYLAALKVQSGPYAAGILARGA